MRDRTKYAERQQISHLIRDPSPCSFGSESMFVMPQLTRPLQLHIHKTIRAIPFDNLRSPANGKESPARRVADQRAFAHRRRFDAQNTEVHPGGSERLQILRVGEKVEYFVKRTRNILLGAKNERSHKKVSCGESGATSDAPPPPNASDGSSFLLERALPQVPTPRTLV